MCGLSVWTFSYFDSAKATSSLVDALQNYVHVLTLGKRDIYRNNDIFQVEYYFSVDC